MRFDFEAADTAAYELELTSQSLMEIAALIEGDAPVVTEDWRGRFREVFDVESLSHDNAARTLANDLLTAASMIRAKAVEAAATQYAEAQAADAEAGPLGPSGHAGRPGSAGEGPP
jgi:hypothetical protein